MPATAKMMRNSSPGALSSADRDRVAEIYRRAAELIHAKGYEATSMSDIAEAVQLTKAGLYYYIRSKQDLLSEIMSFGMDRLEEDVIGPALAIDDPEQRLRTIISRHARLVADGIGTISILVDEEIALAPKQRRRIRERKRVYLDLVQQTLTALQSEGKLSDVDPTVATFSLFGLILWLPRWYRPRGRLTPEQVVEEIIKVALGGVLQSDKVTG